MQTIISPERKPGAGHFGGDDDPNERVQFPIVETFSSKRTEPYVGEEFGYYMPDHHFKAITRYKVLAGSESKEIYLLTTDSADLPHDAVEREVVSVFCRCVA